MLIGKGFPKDIDGDLHMSQVRIAIHNILRQVTQIHIKLDQDYYEGLVQQRAICILAILRKRSLIYLLVLHRLIL